MNSESDYPAAPEPLRVQRGRLVRETAVTWAKRTRNPHAAWLTPFDDLDEDRQEACMLIGEAVAEAERARLFARLTAYARELESEHEPPGEICKHAEGIRLAVQHCGLIPEASRA